MSNKFQGGKRVLKIKVEKTSNEGEEVASEESNVATEKEKKEEK